MRQIDQVTLPFYDRTFSGQLYEVGDFYLLTFQIDGTTKKAKLFRTQPAKARLIAWSEWISYLRAAGIQVPGLQSDGYIQAL